jgi:hypothetical protein
MRTIASMVRHSRARRLLAWRGEDTGFAFEMPGFVWHPAAGIFGVPKFSNVFVVEFITASLRFHCWF